MSFNKDIDGLSNEIEFVKYLNNKKFYELNPIFQDLLIALYGKIHDKEEIFCWNSFSVKKADIYIKVKNKIKSISIKKGIKNSVHLESINCFIKFLKELKIDQEIINLFLYYHYADGTTDGTGNNRISSEEYRKSHMLDIVKINKVFNKRKYIKKFTERFILRGNMSPYEVDAIIYGVVNDFIWITNKEIKFIIRKHLEDNTQALHISCLSIQPWARNLNYNIKYEKNRHFVQIKWYNLCDKIIETMAFYRK